MLVTTLLLALLAFNPGDTSTGIDLLKLPHPKLTKVHAGWIKPGNNVTFDGITASATDYEATLTGRTKSGKTWTAHFDPFVLDEIYRADLDGNGTPDYIIFGNGPFFNGRITPYWSLSFLLMDSEGLPVPFFTTIYKGQNGDGIRHLVDFDGRTRLLISTYDENASDPRAEPFGSGHWTTQLYEFRNTEVREVSGTFEGISFPFIRNWTLFDPGVPNEPRRLPISAANVRHRGTTTEAMLTARVQNDTSFYTAADCGFAWPDATALDTAKHREIAFPNLRSEVIEHLIQKMIDSKTTVELRGIERYTSNDCYISLVWAHHQSR